MIIRTFYWDPTAPLGLRSKVRRRLTRQKPTWVHGNAGDLFNADLTEWAYPGHQYANVVEDGRRLMLVGSIAGRIRTGDLLAGIGSKSTIVPSSTEAVVSIRGLRGPLTLKAFQDAGHDTTQVRFLADPGLLIARVYPAVLDIQPDPNRVIFIPHYRQRSDYRSTGAYDVVDIDARPRDIAAAIRRAEFVHTSSLHGLIWAHALGRPTQLVTPPIDEPMFKYADYLSSVGLPLSAPVSLDESLRTAASVSAHDVADVIDTIELPDLAEITSFGVVD